MVTKFCDACKVPSNESARNSDLMDLYSLQNKTLAIIMGGGPGTRLFPLTKDRSNPAVPLAGTYRLVDIPIRHCLHSRLCRLYILSQFNTHSLLHPLPP